jgi:tetratricopeptide (TPR) repeat protein
MPATLFFFRISCRDFVLKLFFFFFLSKFENGIRINRKKIGNWTRYADWEASQNEFERARSVMERALDEDYSNPVLWLKYAELEMAQKNINHARNVFDRGVALIPRQSQLWLRYVFMEGLRFFYFLLCSFCCSWFL